MYVMMCMLSKVNLKRENIAADLVIWIIKEQCLEIPLTGYVLYVFLIMTEARGYLMHNIYVLS